MEKYPEEFKRDAVALVRTSGRPIAQIDYAAVYDLVVRLRLSTGIDFEHHYFRHTYATWLLRRARAWRA